MFDGKLYFSAYSAEYGNELWSTDGTEAGTQMVKDINPGDAHADPRFLTVYNNQLYFIGYDYINGSKLWVTDGTYDGTSMVNEGDEGYVQYYLTSCINLLFYQGSDITNGTEPWVSDGTAEGTHMVKDIYPGSYGGCNFGQKCVYNGKLYFNANDGSSNGEQLWVTDGTESGTYIIKPPDSTEPAPLMNALGFKEYNGSLFFGAMFDEKGLELWKLTSEDNTGISAVKNAGLEIYPNPVTSILWLKQASTETYYDIFNLEGKVVLSGKIEAANSFPIDVSGLNQGTYVLRTLGRSIKFIRQ